ncbi:flagellin N-terminal helical domain-containing protein [Georgenia ruanii]|uniref:Flagellin n=1 Tax=Georgenia ruanii TaxID=348442 RepID=A0A7J9UYK3_9MICO|nr:flagellin [Georgenia ruanii]MPV89705.1 flagellin [Georgenia ruanii]
MALTINNNIAAVNAYRNLSNTQNDLSKSLEKLSSGFRINRAADDAAGLAISEGLRSQVGGLKVAARNAQDGISVVQTAEGALTEVHSILQRLRDLGVQAANDSNNDKARENITAEANQLVKELERIGNSTNFNGTKLLDGGADFGSTTLTFQVGADGNNNSQIGVDISSANVLAVANALKAQAGQTSTVDVGSIAADDIFRFSFDPDGVGGVAATPLDVTVGTTTLPTSVGDIVATLNGNDQFSASYVASVNADGKLEVLSRTGGTGATATFVHLKSDGTAPAADSLPAAGTTTAAAAISFDNATKAQSAIRAIDTQIEKISTARANLGAYQNRFEHTVKNINVSIENLSASESRIRDTDMAQEMTAFTRSQILSQAGTAMLAQANQIPQGVLQLLR